jgi:exonuclease SbcD
MKILHTADWHLGKRLESFSRHSEQCEVLQEICEIADREQVDVVLISGDLFDTFNPPIESVELFYKTLKKLADNGRRAVIAIAGNHDSPERLEAPDPLARECGIVFCGLPGTTVPLFQLESGLEIVKSEPGFIEIKLPNSTAALRLILAPFANEQRMRTFLGVDNSESELRNILAERWKLLSDKYCDDKGVNVLIGHLFFMQRDGEIPEEPEEEKPILHVGNSQAVFTENVPANIQYVALGHLHRRQLICDSPCPISYSGSPIAYSFGEANQQKHLILINAEAGKPIKCTDIPLTNGKNLLRRTFENMDDAVLWLNENRNALVELTMVSETFLTAEERRRLNSAHEGIVYIIPIVKDAGVHTQSARVEIDVTRKIEDLFVDYFKYRHGGQEPNESILNLFKEVLSSEEEQ